MVYPVRHVFKVLSETAGFPSGMKISPQETGKHKKRLLSEGDLVFFAFRFLFGQG